MYKRSFNFPILQLTVLIFVTKTCKFEQFPLAIIYKSTGTLAELFNYTTCHLLHPCSQLTIRRVSAGEIKWVLRSFLHKFYNFPRVISFKISSLRWNSLTVATLIRPAILRWVWLACCWNTWDKKIIRTRLHWKLWSLGLRVITQLSKPDEFGLACRSRICKYSKLKQSTIYLFISFCVEFC